MIKKNKFSIQYFSIAAFTIVFSMIVCTILYYAPSWGLQDDFQNLGIAESIWQGGQFWAGVWEVTISDLSYWGMFRPAYHSSVAVTYHFFKDAPWLIYIFIAAFNFLALYIWGLTITNIFSVKKEFMKLGIFLFPLSFLIFTPIWNIFTHISFQEKYVVFFSGLSLYFLHRTYSKDRLSYLVPVVFFLILGMLFKATAVHFAMACIAFAALDLMILKHNRRVSLCVLLVNTAVFIAYYWFVTSNLNGYASQYNLSLGNVASSLWSSPVIIKMLIAIAFLMGIASTMLILRRKNQFSPLVLMFPLGFLSYVLILAPWRFVNYLFSALTPYILAMLFPVYLYFCYKNRTLNVLVNTGLLLMVLVSTVYIAMPRFSKLAEIKKMEDFIANFKNVDDRFFFPPPFKEASMAISYFTDTDVHYFRDGMLEGKNLSKMQNNYLIVNDESATVTLSNIKIDKTVYENNTWRIFQLAGHATNKELFRVDFPENTVAKFKTYLRDL